MVFRVYKQVIDKDSPYFENYGGREYFYIFSPVRKEEPKNNDVMQINLDPFVK